MTRSLLAAAVVVATGCGGASPFPEGQAPGADSFPAAAPASVPDTLVLTTADGFEVWLTDLRTAQDSAGNACQERSVEIRRDTLALRVPLFYTRTPPTVLDRDHLRGELSRDCRTMAVYRIETATARPYKIEDR
jgi:hypothetical protein